LENNCNRRWNYSISEYTCFSKIRIWCSFTTLWWN